jgi:hypothetical protein
MWEVIQAIYDKCRNLVHAQVSDPVACRSAGDGRETVLGAVGFWRADAFDWHDHFDG